MKPLGVLVREFGFAAGGGARDDIESNGSERGTLLSISDALQSQYPAVISEDGCGELVSDGRDGLALLYGTGNQFQLVGCGFRKLAFFMAVSSWSP